MSEENKPKPAERAIAEDAAMAIDLLAHVACWIPSLCTAFARFAGSIVGDLILGLAPQALYRRPLRGLTRSLPLSVLTSLLRRLKNR